VGYAFGHNNNGREIGYGVEATCDWPGCEEAIDRSIGNCCGGIDGIGNAGMDGEAYCGDFFCEKHMSFDVCLKCVRKCPDCKGEARDADGEPCARCDSFGEIGHESPMPAEGYVAKDAADERRMRV
jgi:hypothetical protein